MISSIDTDSCSLYKYQEIDTLDQHRQLSGVGESRFGHQRINMKFLGIALLIVAVAAQALAEEAPEEHSRSKRSFSSQLEKFLEVKLRKILKEGNATLGVPIVDPFDKPDLAVDLDEEKAKVNLVINNLHIEGLAGYKVDIATVNIFPPKITVGLTFPLIKCSGKYSVKGVVMDGIQVYGDGEFRANMVNFSVKAVVAVSTSEGIKVKSINLEISLGGLEFKATGIYNDENTSILLSEIFSDMAPQLIKDYHDEITTNVSAFLLEIINVYLHGKTITDIIAILG